MVGGEGEGQHRIVDPGSDALGFVREWKEGRGTQHGFCLSRMARYRDGSSWWGRFWYLPFLDTKHNIQKKVSMTRINLCVSWVAKTQANFDSNESN